MSHCPPLSHCLNFSSFLLLALSLYCTSWLGCCVLIKRFEFCTHRHAWIRMDVLCPSMSLIGDGYIPSKYLLVLTGTFNRPTIHNQYFSGTFGTNIYQGRLKVDLGDARRYLKLSCAGRPRGHSTVQYLGST